MDKLVQSQRPVYGFPHKKGTQPPVNTEQFEDVLDSQIKRIRDVLVVKAAEYATEDRLANFRKASDLQGIGIPQTIGGFMAKHTVSIFMMLDSRTHYTMDQWDEKITDHINYLILLRAALVEDLQPQEPLC